MSNWQRMQFSGLQAMKLVAGGFLALVLAACSTQTAREAETSAQQASAQQAAAQQELAQLAEQQRQREVEREAAERRAQAQAERERQQVAAQARAEEQRRQREAAERREQERLAAIAAAEAERQQKIDRIAELQNQIAAIEAATRNDESANALLLEAIEVAEELIEVLSEEQGKYENTDEQGNTVEPLAKDLIADLEARKESLLQQASAN